MNVLEEFWYGNLDPAEYDANPSKEYKELVRLISRNEEKLLATMTEEQKERFSRYTDCVRECQALEECLLFKKQLLAGWQNGAGGFERRYLSLNGVGIIRLHNVQTKKKPAGEGSPVGFGYGVVLF